jgi:23S rRNA (pseudouridine1915-N3)-methyltransferase
VRIRVVAVGRLKEPEYRALVDDYFARVRRHVALDEVEIEDGPSSHVLAALTKHAKGAAIIALESRGREVDSPAFAREIETLGRIGKGDIAFVLGGKAGLGKEVLASARVVLSLSQLTFPHRLARLVLAEQLYRAMAILRGEPYAQ